MDSCHIFNILFGGRKTTSELRKCFTGGINRVSKKSPTANSPSRKHSSIQPNSQQYQQQTTKEASGIFEAHLVRLDDGTSGKCGLSDQQRKQSDNQLLDENNNNRDYTERCNGVPSNENPADNKLDNLDEKLLAILDENVESSQQEINVYDNPLVTRDESELIVTYAKVKLPSSRQDQQRHQQQEQQQQRQSPPPSPYQTASNLNDDKTSKKSERVKNLVQSFESNANDTKQSQQSQQLPVTPRRLASRKPPETPPKSTRAKCLNLQLTLRKPTTISVLFQNETFLRRHFFDKLAPIDRCAAAQVCRKWRNILYADKSYWKDLMGVIDCTQLRREHLTECIMHTLQSAKLKHLQLQQQHQHQKGHAAGGITNHQLACITENYPGGEQLYDMGQLDDDEIWRIQELCNRYTMRAFGNGGLSNNSGNANQALPNRSLSNFSCGHNEQNDSTIQSQQHQPTTTTTTATTTTTTTTTTTSGIANSKSNSSQISSSTLSSISISSLLSPLSESSRVDSIKEKLYTTLEERGFVSICLFGATDDDIEDLACRTRPNGAHSQLKVAKLNNCAITDRGLEVFVSAFSQIEELELMGCNEITDSLCDFRVLEHLRKLIITDCINIADGLAQRIIQIIHQLETLVVQAYHLTDAFLEYISLNADTGQLKHLELPNCKGITNSSALTIAKHFQSVETLSISGSAKINDDGIELLAEHMKSLVSLDLGWLKIGDLTLEFVACDLRHLRELVLDRNVHITDMGIGYLATMANLTLLYVRWCPQLTDKSIKSISIMRSLTSLSLAGLHQITARGILSLLDSQQLEELELTNCPAVTCELQQFLSAKMPNCNIIY